MSLDASQKDVKEETDEDDGEEEGTDAVGWVTSMPTRRALVTAEPPPVLVLGAGEGMTVEIGYDLGIVHPPRLMLAGTYKSTNDTDSGNNGGKQQLELQRRFDLSVDESQPLRPPPPPPLGCFTAARGHDRHMVEYCMTPYLHISSGRSLVSPGARVCQHLCPGRSFAKPSVRCLAIDTSQNVVGLQ